MAICSAVLAYGLDSSRNVLSAAAIILFIVSSCSLRCMSQKADLTQVGFSFGLGPIPFLLVSEMVPAPVSTSLLRILNPAESMVAGHSRSRISLAFPQLGQQLLHRHVLPPIARRPVISRRSQRSPERPNRRRTDLLRLHRRVLIDLHHRLAWTRRGQIEYSIIIYNAKNAMDNAYGEIPCFLHSEDD